MTNYERIKRMSLDEMAKFLEWYSAGSHPTIYLKDNAALVNNRKKWLLCENEVPTLDEYNSKENLITKQV